MMAIDSKAKRMNMLSFASPLAWSHHFEVDGAVDADDRAHLLHLYGGNALDNPAEISAGGVNNLFWPMFEDKPKGGEVIIDR